MSNSTFTNNFEGGTNGAVVGSGSGGGTAFAASDATVLYDSTIKAHGTLSARASSMGTAATNLNRFALTAETIVKNVIYVNVSALPTADLDLTNVFTTAGGSAAYGRINSAGKLRLAVTGGIFPWTATNTFPLNQWVRVELYANIGSSTTTGVVRLAYFLGDSTTAVEDSGTITGVNSGDGSVNTYGASRFGKCTSSAHSLSLNWDDVAAYTGTSALLGTAQPYSAPASTPPTIVAGAKQVIGTPGSTVNLTSTPTLGTGTSISSYQWTPTSWPASLSGAPTITNPTSQTASFTPTARGRYLFSVTCTDNTAQTSAPATAEVDVTDVAIYPIGITANSGWTVNAITDGTDASDLTYYESGAPGSNSILVLRLAPLVSNGTSFPLDVRDLVQTVSGTQKVELVQGATTTSDGTVRKNWGAIAPGTAFADQILTLTSAEMATITDWTDLHLRLTQV